MTRDGDISRLTPAERILLAQDLWDSVALEAESMPLTPAQQQEIERRLAAADRGAVKYSPWNEVKRRLLRRE
jgi:putative addiction module component (TIGR02574 family)